VPALFPWFIVLVVALVWVVVFHFVQIRLAGFDLRGDFFAGEPGFDEPVGQKQQLLDPDSVLDTCCRPGRMETSHQYHSLVERHRIAIWQEKNQNRESWIDGFPELSTAILSGQIMPRKSHGLPRARPLLQAGNRKLQKGSRPEPAPSGNVAFNGANHQVIPNR
jgi:hypothetical protein